MRVMRQMFVAASLVVVSAMAPVVKAQQDGGKAAPGTLVAPAPTRRLKVGHRLSTESWKGLGFKSRQSCAALLGVSTMRSVCRSGLCGAMTKALPKRFLRLRQVPSGGSGMKC